MNEEMEFVVLLCWRKKWNKKQSWKKRLNKKLHKRRLYTLSRHKLKQTTDVFIQTRVTWYSCSLSRTEISKIAHMFDLINKNWFYFT